MQPVAYHQRIAASFRIKPHPKNLRSAASFHTSYSSPLTAVYQKTSLLASFLLTVPDSQETLPKETLYGLSPDARQKSNSYAARQAAAVGNLFFGSDGRKSD